MEAPLSLRQLLVLLTTLAVAMGRMGVRRRRASIGQRYLVRSMRADAKMRSFFLSQHNDYRRKVPATNMRQLRWSTYLQQTAQAHADTCDFRHSKGRKNVGENIWAAPFSDYSSAVRLWFDEVYIPSCKCQHVYKHCCGHYTQVVWADSSLLGCGMAECRNIITAPGHRYLVVCHYNPTGNIIRAINGNYFYVPAFQWQNETQPACSSCPEDASKCNRGLCVP